MELLVENNKVDITGSIENSTGLGIANTKSRLELLYPGRHRLIINDGDIFSVSLFLSLS